MGFFRDVGERVERFKQQVEDVAKDEAEYECLECGSAVYAEREECPECGAAAVAEREPSSDTDPDDGVDSGPGDPPVEDTSADPEADEDVGVDPEENENTGTDVEENG